MADKIHTKQMFRIIIFSFIALFVIYLPLFTFYMLCDLEIFAFINDKIGLDEVIGFILNIIGYLIFFMLYRLNLCSLNYVALTKSKLDLKDVTVVIIMFFSYFIVELGYSNPPSLRVERTEIQLVMAWLSALFVAPIVEEMLFRGILFEHFIRSSNMITSSVLTSVIFGLCHYEPRKMAGAFIFSILICASYHSTKNIFIPILGHFIFNFSPWIFIILNKLNITTIDFLEASDRFKIPLLITITAHIMLIISCIYMLGIKKKQKNRLL